MKSYKILTLGASGAGKTVFMASMFRSLSTQGEYGFYLEAEDFNQQRRLNQIYTELIAGGKWPRANIAGNIDEWRFTCCIRNPNLENFPICEFIYFDYAGDRFTRMDKEDYQLQEIIKQADAILGLLDGQKIQALMNNNNEQKIDNFLNEDLPPIIKWMSYCQAPIQFVISKWDLLENDNFGLKEISDHLLKIPEFKELVVNRNKEGSPVRLIPVSSIGSGFATPQPDGSMKKIAGSIPRPFHMGVPVSCVIPDILEKEVQVNLKRLTNINDKNIGEDSILNQFLRATLKFKMLIDITLNFLVSVILDEEKYEEQLLIKFIKEALKKVDDLVFARVQKRLQKNDKQLAELREIRDESILKINDETTALKSAITTFIYISNKLTEDFPDSEIIVDKLKQ
ncbi:MAG: hypothetical protein F6K54_00840 [Okeania sp. SIO3B5]|uniref:hypothetical protein n=1 Tax=Okeania sp. SIO3B5 TaxID=2607811 RepID=UPI00140128CA|nr:hypothetical protein [Okeania sp. SIO3B5]NEO51759.1 hypothetical protein [Okeania sp. SIO3B5]